MEEAQSLIKPSRELFFYGGASSYESFVAYISKDSHSNSRVNTEVLMRSSSTDPILTSFAKSKGMTIQEVEERAIQDTSISLEYIKSATSEGFYNALIELLSTPAESYEKAVAKYIESGMYTNTEIAFLTVLSVPDEGVFLRSSFGCLAKRYWHLTKIAVGTIGVALIEGPDVATRHATTELEEMKKSGKYDCQQK